MLRVRWKPWGSTAGAATEQASPGDVVPVATIGLQSPSIPPGPPCVPSRQLWTHVYQTEYPLPNVHHSDGSQ